MNFLRKVKAMFDAMLPWPSRQERKESINVARSEKETAQRKAEHAKRLETQFRRIVEDNHFAESIARQIIRKENRDDG